MPAAASAAGPAGATISACGTDSMTVAGKVALSGQDARKARGAVLQLRFQGLALFGLPHSADWKSLGKKTKGSGQEVFAGLPADNWIGVMSWRFKKGSRTVLAGIERSQPLRIGRKKGRANCTIAKGLKPIDTTAPQLSIVPDDALWHRATTTVQLIAQDDFSGVKSVRYSLDGGPVTPIPNGGSFDVAAEGAHTVSATATDVAGNTTSKTATVRVDAAPPTKPVVQSPPSVTANTAPTISWTPSTDSGSGLHGYVVTITRADGSTVATLTTDASTTSVQSPPLADNQNYTATVTAVDNTSGSPWATNSDPYGFRVDTTAQVTDVTPPSGTILSGSAKDTTFTITLDRPADPATVSGSVHLHNVDANSNPSATIGCAATPCTKITVDPQSTLGEGRYQLTVNGLKSGNGENTPFQAFTAVYSVAFLESANGADVSGVCISSTTKTASTATTALTAPDATETGRYDFDWSFPSGTAWSAQPMMDGAAVGTPVQGGPGSGHSTASFPLAQGSHTYALQFTASCTGTNANPLDTSNIVGARNP